MADEEGRLSFVAGMDDSDFVRGANNIRNEINRTANDVRKTGMTVDEFVSHMQGLVSSFDKLTQSVDKNTKAQEAVAEAGKKAAAEEKEGADKATRAIKETTKATNELGGSFDNLKSKVAGALTFASLIAFEKKVIEVRSEMESLQKSFESLAGEHVGRQLYEDIKQFATTTPMMMKDLAKGAQTLLGFNMEAEKIMPILRQIGDISMGDAQKFNSLTLAFAQMSSTGKLMGQDLLQMINAGFNPLVTISEKTGKSIGELKDEMAKGAITVEMVEDAFRTATAEGGKFHNMLETQSKTMKGALSNLQGAYEDMLNEIGEKQQGVMLKGIEITQKLVQNYETVGKVLLTIIATYGTYRAAVMAATVAENLLNGTYTVKIRLLRAAAAAQTLLNKTMLANPYVLAATALAAVVSSLIAFRSRTDEASEAQKRINSTFEETQGKIAAEQKQIDSLFDKLRKAEKGTDEYKKAKDAILNQYGDYLKGLGQEIETLENVEKAYREVAKAAREAALARGREAALGEANENYGKGYASNMGKLQKALTSTTGKKEATEALKQIQKELRDTGTISTETEKKVRNLLRGSADYGNAEAWFTSLRKNEEELQDAIERTDTLFKQESKGVTDSTTKAKSLGKAYSEAQENFEKAFNKIEDMKKSRAEYTEQQWKEAQEALKNAKKTFEELGGDPDGKQAKKNAAAASKEAKTDAAERQKEYDLDLKQREEQAKKVQAAENALAAAEIAATRNAAERERKERENQHRLALQQIDDEEEEMKKRQVEAMRARWEAQKENKDKAWADTATAKDIAKNGYANIVLPEEDMKLLKARRKLVNEESKRDQHDTAEALIREYQSYTDRKEAIDEKYREATESINVEIVKAQERGDQQAVDALRRSLAEAAKERAKGQAQLSLEQLKETPEYVRAFEDLGDTSTRTIQILISQFEQAKEAAARSMNPEDLREYSRTLEQLYAEIDRRDPFKAMANSSKELEKAQERTRRAASRLDAVQRGAKIPIYELDKATNKIVTTYLTEAQAEKELAKAEDDEAKKKNKHSKAVKAAKDEIEELANSIRGLGDAMGGIGGEILNIIGDVMSVTMGVMNAVEITSKTAAESISTVEKASVILAVISAALQVVMKIAEVAKGLFGADDGEQFEKAKQSYEALSDVWDELIEKKREYLDESWGKEAKAATQEIIRLLEAEQKQAEILARQRLDVTNGSHSMWYRMWQGSYKSSVDDNKGTLNEGAVAMFGKINWRDVNHAIEQGLKSAGLGDVTFNAMEDMLTFTGEQLDWIKTNYTGLWTAMDDDFRELLEKHASLTGDMEEAIKAMQERMTGTTAENVIEDFMEALYGLADGSADVMEEVADDWQQMVNRMAVNTLVTQELKERLTKWYENLAKIEEDYTSGIIGEEEYRNRLNAAQKDYNDTLEETRQRMTTLQEMGVIKPIEETAKEISEVFDSIRDAWASAVTGMKEDSESLGKEIARIMFENLVQSNVFNKDFDDWLKNWVSRYEAALNVKAPGEREGQLRQLEEERKNKIHALTEATKAYAEAAGYAAEEDSEFTNSLDNLGDTLLNALLDTETDAAEMGKKIAQNLIREMLSEMLAADKYKTQTEAIRQLWQNVLKSENGTFIDAEGAFGVKDAAYTYSDVLKRIADLNNQIADDDAITTLADQYRILNETTEKAKSAFDGLHDTFLNDLTDMESSVEKFRENLEKTLAKDLIDNLVLNVPLTLDVTRKGEDGAIQTLKEQVFDSFDAYSADWNTAYLEGMEELRKAQVALNEARKSGDEESIASAEKSYKAASAYIDSLIDELVAMEAIAMENAEELRKKLQTTVKDTTFTDMESNFVSALMDMNGDIEDFANDMKKTIVQKLVESFMVGEKIKPILDDLQKTFDYALSVDDDSWTPEQRAEFIESGDANHSGINDYLKDFHDLQDIVKAIMKAIGYEVKESEKDVETAFSGLGDTILSSLMDVSSGAEGFMKSITDTIARELTESYMATEEFKKGLATVKKDLEDAVKAVGDAEKGVADASKALAEASEGTEEWVAANEQLEIANRNLEAANGQLAEAKGNAKAFYDTAEEGTKRVRDSLYDIAEDTTFKDMTDDFLSALMDMDSDAETWGEKIGRAMATKIIEQMLTIQPVLDNIQNAYAEAVNEATGKDGKIDWEAVYNNAGLDRAIEESKQYFNDTRPVVEKVFEAFGISLQSAVASFGDINSALTSALTDADMTAEKFGAQIGKTMAEQMLESYVANSKWNEEFTKLNEQWNEAVKKGDTAAMERIRQAMVDLYKQMGAEDDTIKELTADINGFNDSLKEVELPFSNLKDMFVSALTDADFDPEEFANQILSSLYEEMLNEMMDSKYSAQIDAIREMWRKVLKGEADEEGRKYTIDDVRGEINALKKDIDNDDELVGIGNSIKKLNKTVDESTKSFDNLHDHLLSAFMDGGDAVTDFRKKLEDQLTKDMIDKFVLNVPIKFQSGGNTKEFKSFSEYEEGWMKRYYSILDNKTLSDEKKEKMLNVLVDEMVEQTAKMDEAAKKIYEARKRSETDTTFTDMEGDVLSALMDIDGDVEDFANNMKKTIVQKLIEGFMVSEKIKPLLNDLQNTFNHAMELDLSGLTDDEAAQERAKLIAQGYTDAEGVFHKGVNAVTKEIEPWQQTTKALLESIGYKFDEINKEGFSDLRGSFVSALSDMESDAASYGKSIAKTMYEQMLDAYIGNNDEWSAQIKQYNEEWAAALESGSVSQLEDIKQKVIELYEQIGKDETVKNLRKDLADLDRTFDETFTSMSGNFVSMLMDFNATADDWGREIGTTLAKRIIEEMMMKQYITPYLDKVQKAFSDAITAEGATMATVQAELQKYVDEAKKAFNEAAPAIKKLMNAFQLFPEAAATPIDDLRSSFRSALMDMSNDTKSFADDINKILTEAFIDKFVLGEGFDKKLKEWQKQYEQIMGSGISDKERAKQLTNLKNTIAEAKKGYAEEAKAIHELMGTNNVEDQSAYMNTAQSITYDQADLIGGMMTSLVMGQGEGNEVRKQILATLQAMQNVTTPKTDYGQQIFQRLGYTNDYLRDIRKTAEAMLSSFTDKLNAVIERLS